MNTLLAVLFAASPPPAGRPAKTQDSPFVCNLGVLTAADRVRKEEICRSLHALMTNVRELPNGFEFQFKPEPATLPLIGEWTWTERLCCPFLDFELRVEREGGTIVLRLTGRPGTKDFINADFGRWLQGARG